MWVPHISLSWVTWEICSMPSIFTRGYRLTVQLPFGMSLVLVAERRRCGKHALGLEDFFHCFVNFKAMPHFKWVWKCNLTSVCNEGNQNHRGQQKGRWQIYNRSLYVILKVLCSHLLLLPGYLRLILVRKINKKKENFMAQFLVSYNWI